MTLRFEQAVVIGRIRCWFKAIKYAIDCKRSRRGWIEIHREWIETCKTDWIIKKMQCCWQVWPQTCGKVGSVLSRSQAQGNAVGLPSGLGTRYGIYLHMSRDLEVTPPCSIRPLPFGDVLVVRTRKLTNEKMKKNGQKTGVSEHNANKENKTKVKKMR